MTPLRTTDTITGAVSFFGWLDHDETQAQRMREVLAAFDDKDTIDSLGIGMIRDSIADQLFPGISTIQTRARYFFFVPWICRILEDEHPSVDQFAARLRDLEVDLIGSLRRNHDAAEGVIGYRAGRALVRLPTSVYWNGLGVLGIRRLDLSLACYRERVAHHPAARVVRRNDDGDLLDSGREVWVPSLPAAPGRFPNGDQSLELTSGEADHLADRFMTAVPGTLLAELARDLTIDRRPDSPWELDIPNLPVDLALLLRHARNFSLLVHGAHMRYNLSLADRAANLLHRDTGDLVERFTHELHDWADQVTRHRGTLTEWITTSDFWTVVDQGARIPTPTRRFVREWAKIVLYDPHGAVDDPGAAALIAARERRLKGRLARLSNERALDNWRGEPFSTAPLTYRWPQARQMLDDIAAATA